MFCTNISLAADSEVEVKQHNNATSTVDTMLEKNLTTSTQQVTVKQIDLNPAIQLNEARTLGKRVGQPAIVTLPLTPNADLVLQSKVSTISYSAEVEAQIQQQKLLSTTLAIETTKIEKSDLTAETQKTLPSNAVPQPTIIKETNSTVTSTEKAAPIPKPVDKTIVPTQTAPIPKQSLTPAPTDKVKTDPTAKTTAAQKEMVATKAQVSTKTATQNVAAVKPNTTTKTTAPQKETVAKKVQVTPKTTTQNVAAAKPNTTTKTTAPQKETVAKKAQIATKTAGQTTANTPQINTSKPVAMITPSIEEQPKAEPKIIIEQIPTELIEDLVQTLSQ